MASGTVRGTLTLPSGQTRNIGVLSDTLEAWVRTKPLDFTKPELEKLIQGIVAELKGSSPTLTVRVGTKDRISQDYTWCPAVLLTDLPIWFPCVPGARYVAFEFKDTAVQSVWKLSSFDVFGVFDGGKM